MFVCSKLVEKAYRGPLGGLFPLKVQEPSRRDLDDPWMAQGKLASCLVLTADNSAGVGSGTLRMALEGSILI
jgi:hypothetical protein